MNLPPAVRRFGGYLWREWLRPLALPLLLITAAKASLADINYVPSGSMQPTVLPGDVVFINKLAYDLRIPFTYTRLAQWADPRRGDIVVCYEPHDGTRLVKRVVGAPGDTIAMREDVLFLNGRPLAYRPLDANAGRALPRDEQSGARFATEVLGTVEHAVMTTPGRPAGRNFGPVKVPAGQYLVLGDNRDNSRDSRYFGYMPRNRVIGRVKGVFVSADPNRWLMPRPERFFEPLP